MNKFSLISKKLEVVSEGLQDINKHFDTIELDTLIRRCGISIQLIKCRYSMKRSLNDMWFLIGQLELNRFNHVYNILNVFSDGLSDIDKHIFLMHLDVCMGRSDFNINNIKLVIECVKSMELAHEEMIYLLDPLECISLKNRKCLDWSI